jgi:hypothetical protein
VIRLLKKRSIRVSSVPVEQHQPLQRINAPDESCTTGMVLFGAVPYSAVPHGDVVVISQVLQ